MDSPNKPGLNVAQMFSVNLITYHEPGARLSVLQGLRDGTEERRGLCLALQTWGICFPVCWVDRLELRKEAGCPLHSVLSWPFTAWEENPQGIPELSPQASLPTHSTLSWNKKSLGPVREEIGLAAGQEKL